ncbi:MAG: hypothetical protein E2604_16990 [Flavobacterium sp.]|nr:hypothetical protein [Flavobacterium sp.]
MKTENTEYPIQNLVSMTDFVLNEKVKLLHFKVMTRYAEFLKQPLKIEMFIPDDEFGFDKVLFPGFKVQETSQGLEIFGQTVLVRFGIERGCTVESLCLYELPLSQSALQSIFKNLLSQ